MKYDVGIILSHWLKEDGSLSDETRERVDLGIDLLERGVVGGLVGKNKVMITCLKCGHQWKAGSQ